MKTLVSALVNELLEWNLFRDSDREIKKKEIKRENINDETAIDQFLRKEFQEFLDRAYKKNIIKKEVKLDNKDLQTILEDIRWSLNESSKEAKKNKKLARMLQAFINSVEDYKKELKLAESEYVQQFTSMIKSLRDEVAGDRVAVIERSLGAEIEDETDSLKVDKSKDISKRTTRRINKKLDALDSIAVDKKVALDEGKNTNRIQKKEEKNLSRAKKHMDIYLDALTTSTNLDTYEAHSGEKTESTIKDDQTILWFLLSDINFDGWVVRTPDKWEYLRANKIWSFIAGPYKEKKYAQDFESTASKTITETQIREAYSKAISELMVILNTTSDDPTAQNKVATNIASYINTLIGDNTSSVKKITLGDGFTTASLITAIKEDPRYLTIFREQWLYLFPGNIVDIFLFWDKTYEQILDQNADIVAHNFDLQTFNKTYDELSKTHPEIAQLENLSDKKIDKLIGELESMIISWKDSQQQTLSAEQLNQLKEYAADLKNNRSIHKRNFTIGWLALFFQAHHLMGYTNNQGAKVPGKNGLDALGLWVGWTLWQDLIGDFKQNISWWVAVVWANYYNDKKSSVQPGLNVWVSIWYNATKDFGKRIGNTNYKPWMIGYGTWVGWWAGKSTTGFSLTPYVYVWGEALLNKKKLTNTLDAKSAQYLWAGVTAWLFGISPSLTYRRDKIAGIDISSDAIYTKTRGIFESLFASFKGKKAWDITYQSIYDTIKASLGKDFDKSKNKTIVRHAMMITGIIETIKSDKVWTLDESAIKVLADHVAYNYSLNRYNTNIDKLTGLSITSVAASINPLTLFGVLWTWFTHFRNATTSDDLRSTSESITRINRNTGARELIRRDEKSNVSIKVTLKDVVEQAAIEAWLKTNKNLMRVEDDNIILTPEFARISKVQIRIKPGFEKYLASDKDNNLIIPGDIVSGYSSILQGNQTINILSLWYTVEEPLIPWNERRGTNELYKGIPNNKGWAQKANIVLAAKAKENYRTYKQRSWEDQTVDGKKYIGIQSKLKEILGDDFATLITFKSFDPKESTLVLDLKWNKDNPITFELVWDKTYAFEYNKKEGVLHVDKKNNDKKGIEFTYQTKEHKETSEEILNIIWFTDFSDHVNGEYKKISRDIDHASNEMIKKNNMQLHVSFSQAMDSNNFAKAAWYANSIMKILGKDWYTFTGTSINELYDLSERLISSAMCEINGNAVTTRWFGKKMSVRDEARSRRWNKGVDTKTAPLDTVNSYRTKSMASMFSSNNNWLTMDNYKTTTNDYSFGIERGTHNNMLSLVYWYAGVNDSQNEKLVIWPDITQGSGVAIDGQSANDNTYRQYIFSQIMSRYNNTTSNGGTNILMKPIIDNLWTIDSATKKDILFQLTEGKTTIQVTVNNKTYTINADYQFFFYPDCLNESVWVEFKVSNTIQKSEDINGEKKTATLTDQIPWQDTWFFTNISSVAQRAAVTATNFSITWWVRVVKSTQTQPGVDEGWEVTTEPWVVEIDGQIIKCSEQTNTIYTVNGKTINIEFLWYGNDGRPIYSVVVTDTTGKLFVKIWSLDQVRGGLSWVDWWLLPNFEKLDKWYISVLHPSTWWGSVAPKGRLTSIKENPLFVWNPAWAAAAGASMISWNYQRRSGSSYPSQVKQEIESKLSWYLWEEWIEVDDPEEIVESK